MVRRTVYDSYALSVYLIFSGRFTFGEVKSLLGVSERQVYNFLKYLVDSGYVNVVRNIRGVYYEFTGKFVGDFVNRINELRKESIVKSLLVKGEAPMEFRNSEHLYLELLFEGKIKVKGLSDETLKLVVETRNSIPDGSLIRDGERGYFYVAEGNGRRVWKLRLDKVIFTL